MKLTKINPKAFIKEITNYQNRIFYSNKGQCIKYTGKELGIDLTVEQIAYIHSIMTVCDFDYIDYGMGYVDIPVELLFTLMTPYKSTLLKKKNSKAIKYMASVTLNCIIPLKDIIIFKNKKEGQCRKFAILKQFVEKYYMKQQLNLYDLENSLEDDWDYFTKFKRGIGFENPSRLNELTIKAVDKARNSKFVFDTVLFKESKEFIANNLKIPGKDKLNRAALDNLKSTLNFIYKKDNTPQYHTTYHLQNSGRVHTIGGCIQLPKWFRTKFIKGINPNSVKVEFDLKCAQLLILCEILGQHNLKTKILNILESEGSIWNSIGSQIQIDKRVKKIIVYGFCFGAELNHLPYLASKEARRLNLGPVNKKIVNDCLKGLLSPLVKAREEWLSVYKAINIIKSKDKILTNALGYSFSLTEKAVRHYSFDSFIDNRKNNSTKIGSQLLAFLCQGMEQYYIQHLIANHVEDNILMWNYDGFVLELSPDKVNTVINHLLSSSLAPLEYEILTD